MFTIGVEFGLGYDLDQREVAKSGVPEISYHLQELGLTLSAHAGVFLKEVADSGKDLNRFSEVQVAVGEDI